MANTQAAPGQANLTARLDEQQKQLGDLGKMLKSMLDRVEALEASQEQAGKGGPPESAGDEENEDKSKTHKSSSTHKHGHK